MKVPALSTIKAFVFDFDGTLVHSNEIKQRGLTAVTKELGDISHHLDDILAKKLGDRFVIFQVLSERLYKEGRLPSKRTVEEWAFYLTNAYTDYCEKNIVEAAEVAGAEAAFKELRKRGKDLFINTATPEGPVRNIVEKRKWKHYFKAVLGGPQTKVENLQKISKDFEILMPQMVFVGDGEPDKAASEQAGCFYVGLQNEFSKYKHLPEYKINSLEELLNMF